MRFVFSRRSAEPPSGFDLGDLTITGADGSVTSAGRRPDQSFMIYVGIVDLVDGLTGLTSGSRKTFDFVGPDSSFTVHFRREGDRIATEAYGSLLAGEPAADTLAALRAAVEDFLATDPLDRSEPGAEDLTAALAALRS